MRILRRALIFFLVIQTSIAMADAAATRVDSSSGSSGTTDPKVEPVQPPTLVSATAKTQGKAVIASVQSCNDSSSTARTYCLSNLNPKIQTASGMIGVLLSGAAALKSTSESCQKYNQALKIAEMALTAYNGMCTAAQMNCESSCEETKTDLEALRDTLKPVATSATSTDAPLANNDLEAVNTAWMGIRRKLDVCKGYKMNLAAAGVGLMNVVKQSTMASTCTNATTVADCTKDPTTPACLAAAGQVDCSKAENQQNTQCVCQRAPNTAGCPGAVGQSGSIPTGASSASLSGQSATVTPPTTSGTDSSGLAAGGSGSGSGGGSLGAFGGGGGGGGMGSGGAAQKTGADGKTKSLNANILSGYDGGGGGGGRGGGGSASSNSAYNAYLPGGAKDPNRGLASKTFGNGEVTAAGSKSNWEKVSERYKDNKPTLMGP